MLICIENVIDLPMLNTWMEAIAAAPQIFTDGAQTAGWQAKAVKRNQQASGELANRITTLAQEKLLANPVFKAAAQPKTIIKTLLSKYQTGQAYGSHVDEPMMVGNRVDLSFTLFLSDPKTYDGGALIIENPSGEQSYKLMAGSLVLYPTTALHRVGEITSGKRLAIVGWVRSLIRNAQDRETIFDIENLIASLRSTHAERALIDQALKIRANLLQRWIED
jgi:PKHD-type hydroxylase